MNDCLFCSIVSGTLNAHRVGENEQAIAFLDVHPRAPGHTVVIPKMHAATIVEVPESVLGPLFSLVQSMTVKLERSLKPDGFTIGINHGQVSGQSVNHLHIHILPRFAGDKGSSVHSVVRNVPEATLENLAKTIVSSGS